MDSKAKTGKGARRRVEKPSLLEGLKSVEADSVLRRLLKVHPDLRGEAERIARSLLHEQEFEDVAAEVEEEVQALDYDDLNGCAGTHKGGYIEPTEAALDLLEEAVEPFISDLKRHIDLGLEGEALEICKGVVLGLYRVRDGQRGDVLGWAPDFPAEEASHAVSVWYRGRDAPGTPAGARRRKRPPFPKDFLCMVPEWTDIITRASSGKS